MNDNDKRQTLPKNSIYLNASVVQHSPLRTVLEDRFGEIAAEAEVELTQGALLIAPGRRSLY